MFAGMHFSLVLSQAFKDFFPSVSGALEELFEHVIDEASGGCYSRLYQDSDIPRPGTTLYYCLLRHLSSLMVLWALPGVMLAYRCLHLSMYGWCGPHDFDTQRWCTILWPDSVMFWPIRWSQCKFKPMSIQVVQWC